MQPPWRSFLEKLSELMGQFRKLNGSKSEQKKIGMEAKVKQFRCTKNENACFFGFRAKWDQKFFFGFVFHHFQKKLLLFS